MSSSSDSVNSNDENNIDENMPPSSPIFSPVTRPIHGRQGDTNKIVRKNDAFACIKGRPKYCSTLHSLLLPWQTPHFDSHDPVFTESATIADGERINQLRVLGHAKFISADDIHVVMRYPFLDPLINDSISKLPDITNLYLTITSAIEELSQEQLDAHNATLEQFYERPENIAVKTLWVKSNGNLFEYDKRISKNLNIVGPNSRISSKFLAAYTQANNNSSFGDMESTLMFIDSLNIFDEYYDKFHLFPNKCIIFRNCSMLSKPKPMKFHTSAALNNNNNVAIHVVVSDSSVFQSMTHGIDNPDIKGFVIEHETLAEELVGTNMSHYAYVNNNNVDDLNSSFNTDTTLNSSFNSNAFEETNVVKHMKFQVCDMKIFVCDDKDLINNSISLPFRNKVKNVSFFKQQFTRLQSEPRYLLIRDDMNLERLIFNQCNNAWSGCYIQVDSLPKLNSCTIRAEFPNQVPRIVSSNFKKLVKCMNMYIQRLDNLQEMIENMRFVKHWMIVNHTETINNNNETEIYANSNNLIQDAATTIVLSGFENQIKRISGFSYLKWLVLIDTVPSQIVNCNALEYIYCFGMLAHQIEKLRNICIAQLNWSVEKAFENIIYESSAFAVKHPLVSQIFPEMREHFVLF